MLSQVGNIGLARAYRGFVLNTSRTFTHTVNEANAAGPMQIRCVLSDRRSLRGKRQLLRRSVTTTGLPSVRALGRQRGQYRLRDR